MDKSTNAIELSDGTQLEHNDLAHLVNLMRAVRASGMVNMISRFSVADVLLLMGDEEEAGWLRDKKFKYAYLEILRRMEEE